MKRTSFVAGLLFALSFTLSFSAHAASFLDPFTLSQAEYAFTHELGSLKRAKKYYDSLWNRLEPVSRSSLVSLYELLETLATNGPTFLTRSRLKLTLDQIQFPVPYQRRREQIAEIFHESITQVEWLIARDQEILEAIKHYRRSVAQKDQQASEFRAEEQTGMQAFKDWAKAAFIETLAAQPVTDTGDLKGLVFQVKEQLGISPEQRQKIEKSLVTEVRKVFSQSLIGIEFLPYERELTLVLSISEFQQDSSFLSYLRGESNPKITLEVDLNYLRSDRNTQIQDQLRLKVDSQGNLINPEVFLQRLESMLTEVVW